MEIPNIQSENFTLREVIHRDEKITWEVVLIASYLMGRLQDFRDHLCQKFAKNIRIVITSGRRALEYNRSIGSSDNSYHIWRLDDKHKIVCAADITSPDLELEKLFIEAARFFKGEIYKHNTLKFVHLGLYGVDETFELS